MSGLIQDTESIEILKKNNKIGDILDVEVIVDFNYKLDMHRPRPIILISLPQTACPAKTSLAKRRPPQSYEVSAEDGKPCQGFFFGMVEPEGKKSQKMNKP